MLLHYPTRSMGYSHRFMGFYEQRVLPHIINLAMNTKAVNDERRRCLADVKGTVLEVGFGSGRNLPHYPRAVSTLIGVDPSAASARLARARIDASPFPVRVVGLSAEQLPVDDGSVDSIVSTFTLCTIADVASALLEMRRALRPAGRFYFVEHGLADDPGVQRWQHRLNPIEQAVFGGCNLNRRISTLIQQAGFEIERLEHGYLKGAPKFAGFLYRGVAKQSGV
jgi:ubiquinone/menaquinone biosynthesis C-methylase UbiE